MTKERLLMMGRWSCCYIVVAKKGNTSNIASHLRVTIDKFQDAMTKIKADNREFSAV